MKVFFSTTPRAKKQLAENIQAIFDVLKKNNYQITSDLIENVSEDEFYNWDTEQRQDYYRNTLKSIKDADITIFETSIPSLGVGHLLNQALSFGKPVIAFYTHGNKPFMLDSANLDKVVLVEYSLQTLKHDLEEAIEYASEKNDVRFNFFIPQNMIHYLNWISQHRNMPRSVFLRNLIEERMNHDKEFLNATE